MMCFHKRSVTKLATVVKTIFFKIFDKSEKKNVQTSNFIFEKNIDL